MYIIDYKRTPIGKFLGALSTIPVTELAVPLFSYFLKTYPFLKKKTDEVIIGNVLSAGVGMNPARIAAYRGGISDTVPAYTINHVCASGMNAIIQGYRAIHVGDAQLVIAGGMESMSEAPFLLKGIRKGIRYGNNMLIDSLHHDGLYWCLSNNVAGALCEKLVEKFAIDRQEQDQFALSSHKKALKAQQEQILSQEIISFPELPDDEGPRMDTSLEKLAALRPAFKKNGTITAGNASSMNDGAALVLLASEKALQTYHLQPAAKIIDTVSVGLKPERMGLGPIPAIKKLLKKNNMHLTDIDLFEINEAFAGQVLAVMQQLSLPQNKVNIHGGALAFGHPLGMSGTRIVGSLVTALKQKKGKRGIAALCVGGGQGVAVLIENI